MNVLPRTPFETLQIRNPISRLLITTTSWVAETFSFWTRPRPHAAGDIPEMTLLDNLYWIHKSRSPIERPDPDLVTTDFVDAPAAWRNDCAAAVTAKTATISFVGDILRSHRATAKANDVFADIANLVFEADISVANYESPVTDKPLVDEVIGDGGPPVECASAEDFAALTSHMGKSFDVLNLANNHVFDMGADGVEATLAACDKAGALPLGIYNLRSDQIETPTLTRNGIKFGFASCTYGTNGHALPLTSPFGVYQATLCSPKSPTDLSLLKAQISQAQDAGCDFIIANLHWGHEFELFPRRAQQLVAEELADFGADLIVGHHPHVTQPIQLYRSKARGNRIVPIAYSLGSLLWGFSHDEIAKSTVLNITVQKQGDKSVLSDLSAVPVTRIASQENGEMVHRVARL